MALFLRYAVRSDLGLVRGNNEDSVYAGPRLLAIADGMGGHAAGEVASKIMISALENLDEDRTVPDLTAALRNCVAEGNQEIADAAEEKPELEGMGTTLTALRFAGAHVGMVHVGDSRAYLLRGGELSQITHDDTYVQFLVDSGKLTADEAKDHPRKSVILKALTGAEVEPDVSIREAVAGDRYLLCTDGLSDVVSSETIREALQIEDVQESADRLVELALRGGGPDNVTVIVSDVVEARVGDHIDDVPVIAGAFVDPNAADVPGDHSPAERAARIGRPDPVPVATPDPAPRTANRRRRYLALLIASVLVLGALVVGYFWTRSQYFVGRDGQYVAIFRGVDADFGVTKLYDKYEGTDLKVDDLYPTYQSQVRSGITAHSAGDARDIIASLRSELLPVCPAATPTVPTPTNSTSTGATPSGGATVGPGSGAPDTSTRSSTGRPGEGAGGNAEGSARRSTSVATQGSVPTTAVSATAGAPPSVPRSSSSTPIPKVTCRR